MIVNDQNLWQRQALTVGVVCVVAQLVLAPYLAIAGGHPNFMVVCALTVSLTGGGSPALLASFLAGLFFDLTSTTPVGLMALELTLASFILGFERRDRIMEEPIPAYRDACLAALAVELVYQLALMMVGQGAPLLDMVFLRWLPASFLDWLALVPFVFVLSRPRTDGLSLGGPKGKGIQGKRYKL